MCVSILVQIIKPQQESHCQQKIKTVVVTISLSFFIIISQDDRIHFSTCIFNEVETQWWFKDCNCGMTGVIDF